MEVTINCVSVAVIIYVGAVALMRRVDQHTAAVSPDRRLVAGTELKLPGVEWRGDKETLVFALQTGCKYCSKSMPFYRVLTEAIQTQAKLNALAVLPQGAIEAAAYLRDNRLSITDTRQVNLMDVGIAGTPTLLLIDKAGKIVQTWTGLLDRQGIGDVLHRLNITLPASAQDEALSVVPTGSSADAIVYTSELLALASTGAPLRIIDVRNRQRFGAGHIEGAYNIPADELATRFPHEIGAEQAALVYCGYSEYCAVNAFSTLCAHAEWELRTIGVKIRVIRDRLPQLKVAGMRITGNADE